MHAAEALIREAEAAALNNGNQGGDGSVLLFSLAEISLMLRTWLRRLTEVRLRPLFQETVEEIDRMSEEWAKRAPAMRRPVFPLGSKILRSGTSLFRRVASECCCC